MAVTYTHAPKVHAIADGLIARHHTDLADIPIAYVFRDRASKTRGRVVAGKARKLSGLNAFLADRDVIGVETDPSDDFFVIEIALDEWERMGPAARKALVDHELCRCTIEFDEESGDVTLGLRGHDVEEFTQIVERHGCWDDDLKQFAEAVKTQMGLNLDGLLPDGVDSLTITRGDAGDDEQAEEDEAGGEAS